MIWRAYLKLTCSTLRGKLRSSAEAGPHTSTVKRVYDNLSTAVLGQKEALQKFRDFMAVNTFVETFITGHAAFFDQCRTPKFHAALS